MFVNKKFVNEGLITKITKILCHENLELYGMCTCIDYITFQQPSSWFFICCATAILVCSAVRVSGDEVLCLVVCVTV